MACLREKAERAVCWTSFHHQCLSHGVLPTIYGTLAEALGKVHPATESFRETYLRSSLTAFQSMPEFIRLIEELDREGIPALGLKGMAVAQQVYGNFTMRPTGDLDLLVPEPLAWKAAGVLRGMGYVQDSPGPLSDNQEKALIKYGEGRQFADRKRGFESDLHWRTLDRWVDVRLTFDDLWERREVLTFPWGTLLTPGLEDTALILCLHGAQHGFARLKWVLDVARCASLAICWDEVRRRAGHRGPMIDYALALAHEVAGSPVPQTCQPAQPVARLVAQTVKMIMEPPARAGPRSSSC